MLYFRELLSQHPENLRTLMTHTVLNELSNSRNPNNMTLLSVMFQHAPEQSAKVSEGHRYIKLRHTVLPECGIIRNK